MKIDAERLSQPCPCGRTHALQTRLCIVEAGVLPRLEQLLRDLPAEELRCAVYDRNTYRAIPPALRPRAAQELILDPQGLHADEHSTAQVLARMAPDVRLMLAVGGGTVHDIVRYCSNERSVPFISVPTAASCDGFCSGVAAMTWHGYKNTMSCQAPLLVAADLDVIAAAPWRLTASGAGDMLGKFVALADWRIAHLLTGEDLCPTVIGMMEQAVQTVWQNCLALRGGGPADYEAVTSGLLMSGLAMQMVGSSRPASGAEHHVSHFIEVEPAALSAHSDALHGEKVGVGTLLIAREYQRLAKLGEIARLVRPYTPVPEQRLMELFGPRLFSACRRENEQDCLSRVSPEALVRSWSEICRIVAAIPPADHIERLLLDLGTRACLTDLGVPEQALPLILEASPLIRNRLTLMRIRRMLRL